MSDEYDLQIKWQTKNLELRVPANYSILQLKHEIQKETQIPIHAQKLCGMLPKGKIPTNEMILKDMHLKNPQKILVIGTAEKEVEAIKREEIELESLREVQRIQEEIEIQRQLEEEQIRKQRELERMEQLRVHREQDAEQRRVEAERRRQEMLQREIEQETDMSATLTFDTKCFSSAFANKPQMEFSDKGIVKLKVELIGSVILPQSTLNDIVNSKLALPLTFKITKPELSDLNSPFDEVNAGVLDFTAPENTIYMPYWMMNKLGVAEGNTLHFRNVHLQKGTFIKLKPLDKIWNSVPPELRKSVLEFSLRNFQSITTGDSIAVNYNNSVYRFNVSELQPSYAVSLTDTDISVDFEEVDEIQSSTENSTSNNKPTEEEITILEAGKQVEKTVAKEAYKYFTLHADIDPNSSLQITVDSLSGEADLYVSTTHKKPSLTDWMWLSQQAGNQNTVEISSKDEHFICSGDYFIAIRGYKDDVNTFKIIAKEIIGSTGQQLGTTDERKVPTKVCSNCQKEIPETVYDMHSATCAKRNFRCPNCNIVMDTRQKQKHIDLVHALFRCDCGILLEQLPLHIHKEHECNLRLVKCVYCPLEIPLNERGEHQQLCGGRTASCSHCGNTILRRDMKRHLERTHQIQISDITQSGELQHLQ